MTICASWEENSNCRQFYQVDTIKGLSSWWHYKLKIQYLKCAKGKSHRIFLCLQKNPLYTNWNKSVSNIFKFWHSLVENHMAYTAILRAQQK